MIMKATTIAKWENMLRPLLTKLPPKTVVSQYSAGRLDFLSKLKDEIPSEIYTPSQQLEREFCWNVQKWRML